MDYGQNTGAVGQDFSSASQPADPLTRRWNELKPIILNLYIEQDMHLTTVANIMRNQYGFSAL